MWASPPRLTVGCGKEFLGRTDGGGGGGRDGTCNYNKLAFDSNQADGG